MKLTAIVVLLFIVGCRDPRLSQTRPPSQMPTCGDGFLQGEEVCDGSELGAGTCADLGFEGGQLVCTSACAYDTTLCFRRCGNGAVDEGETCDGTAGLPACTTWGVNRCTELCQQDALFCVGEAYESGPALSQPKGGVAVVGDLTPAGPGDLVMAVPAFERVEIFPWNMSRGFEVGTSKKLSFLRTPREVEVVDANGDGKRDVATVNADGTFDLLVDRSGSYALQSLDAGCVGATFLPVHGARASTVIAVGCESIFELSATGVTRRAATSIVTAARTSSGVWWADSSAQLTAPDGGTTLLVDAPSQIAMGDLDGDGDDDLAARTNVGVTLYENTGAGFALTRTSSAASVEGLALVDLDGDLGLDVVWKEPQALVTLRNDGSLRFTERRVTATQAPLLRLSVGDVDGDGDPDVVLTTRQAADATLSQVFLNRSR